MIKPLNAQILRMTRPFQEVTVPTTSGHGMTIGAHEQRGYLVRYALVNEVDNEGGQCVHCSLIGADITCNVYVTDMEGEQRNAETCDECALPVVDDVLDTDPSCVVLIERVATLVQVDKGLRR